MKRVLKYSIRIDDHPHPVPGGVPVLFDRNPGGGEQGQVAVWFEVIDAGGAVGEHLSGQQHVQVVGTGQPVADSWKWLASFVDGGFVWHLYSVPAGEVNP